MPFNTFNTRPNVGVDFDKAYSSPPVQLGQKFHGSDGHDYVLAKAGAALAANTASAIADVTFVATAGSGYTSPAQTALALGEFGFFRKTAL